MTISEKIPNSGRKEGDSDEEEEKVQDEEK